MYHTLSGEQFPQQLSPSKGLRTSREVFQQVSKRFCQQNGELRAALGGRPPTGEGGSQRDLSRRLPGQVGRLRSRGGPASPLAPLTAPGEAAAPPPLRRWVPPGSLPPVAAAPPRPCGLRPPGSPGTRGTRTCRSCCSGSPRRGRARRAPPAAPAPPAPRRRAAPPRAAARSPAPSR